MPLVAVSNKIIVEKKPQAKDVDIIVPEGMNSSKHQDVGIILSVGPGKRLSDGSLAAPSVAIGDQIYFNPFGQTVVEHEDVEYLIMTEDDILAVIK